jgi:outer membrane receptor protein involved in Fe transport
VKGAELSLNSRPFRGLALNVAATYLQATIDQFTGINAGGLAANFADTPIPFTPKWQIGTNADYTFAVSSGWDAFVGASVNFRSNTVAIVGGNLRFPVSPYNSLNGLPAPTADPYSIDQYTLVDVRAGVQSKDEKWRFSVWGKNVTNQYYWTNVVAAFDCIVRYSGMPATYGVSATYQFKSP